MFIHIEFSGGSVSKGFKGLRTFEKNIIDLKP